MWFSKTTVVLFGLCLFALATSETVPGVETSTTPSPDNSSNCDSEEKKKEQEEALEQYMNCHEKDKFDSRKLECTRLDAIKECLRVYEQSVDSCYDEDTTSTWKKTIEMLGQSEEYMCDNDGEKRKLMYREGGEACFSDPEVLKCGPNVVDTLVNFNDTTTLHKEVLKFKYDQESCKIQTKSMTCYVDSIKKSCRSKEVAPIINGLFDVFLNSTGCNGAGCLLQSSFWIFALVAVITSWIMQLQ